MIEAIAEEKPKAKNALSIIQTNEPGPIAACVLGPPGVGKTTFCFSAPKPIGILTERGLGDLVVDHFPLCKKFDHVLDAVNRLINSEHEYKTVVLDSLDWLQELIFDHVCRRHNVESIEDANGGYGKGYVEALREWRKLLDLFDILRFELKMNVLMTAHTEVKKVQDPRLPTYDSYAIKLNKRASSVVEEYCDAILFCSWDVTVKETKEGGQKRTRALADAPRIIHTDLSPLYTAKNRFHLPATLPLKWSAFEAALNESRNKLINKGN